MTNNELPSRRELHERAAAYYADKLAELTEEASYATWYSIESKTWQEYEMEWLYHLSQLDDRDEARLQMARSFFKAFWWWGYYIDFEYCRQSLEHFWAAARDAQDARFVELLKIVHSRYPTGYRKTNDPVVWQAVEDSLLKLRTALHLDGGTCQLETGDARLTRGLMSLFLAHSRRYVDPKDTQADAYYADAHACFAADHDTWDLGWTLFEMADLMVERGLAHRELGNRAAVEECLEKSAGYLDESAGYVEALLRDPDDDPDHELIANLHRTYADRHWLAVAGTTAGGASASDAAIAEERHNAFDRYRRAVQHSFLFNGIPEPCDLYTRQFYLEMVERTCERLAEVYEGDPADALRWAMSLRRTAPEPCIRRGGRRSVEVALRDYRRDPDRRLQLLLFPRSPSEADCDGTTAKRRRSPFMRGWRDVTAVEEMRVLALRKGATRRHSDL